MIFALFGIGPIEILLLLVMAFLAAVVGGVIAWVAYRLGKRIDEDSDSQTPGGPSGSTR